METAAVDKAASAPVVLEDEDEDVDAYLSAIFSDEPAREPKQVSFQARAQVEDADAGTLFDLGMAYRDMGLIDEAIGQFEQAASDPRWKARALVMMATLRVHRGETTEAIGTLRDAVDSAKTQDERSEARYELGLVYAKLGETNAAIEMFESVEPGFRDRDERLGELRQAEGG